MKYLKHLLAKVGIKYVRAYAYERPMNVEIPKTYPKIQVSVNEATRDNIHQLYGMREPIRQRVEMGDMCYIAENINQAVGYSWIATGREVYMPEIERRITFMEDEGYLYDAMVFPEFRRKGVMKKMIEDILRYLRSRKISRVYAFASNKITQRVLRKFMFRRTREITYARIFIYREYKERKLR